MAWLQAYTSQGAPEVSVATTQAISTTEENRRKAEERSRIISDEWSRMFGKPMLDKPEKTRRLLAALKAALPFEGDLTAAAVATLAAQQVAVAVKPRQIISDVSYAGDEGGIICHVLPEEGRDAIFISLTHVRAHRSLPFASAVIDYQKHRVKKLNKQQGMV